MVTGSVWGGVRGEGRGAWTGETTKVGDMEDPVRRGGVIWTRRTFYGGREHWRWY